MSNNESLGFANLPNQVHRKSVKKGFEFTLMVVGECGLGKSTLVDSLFRSEIYKDRKPASNVDPNDGKVRLTSNTVDIEERGVKLRLTVVDTDGYGDGLDSSNCTEPIAQYVDEQFEKFFQYENGLNRRQIADSRIHCCFYFISPIGYSLKPIDVCFMKSLHMKVNIIPLIAKADTLTRKEVTEMKRRILADIKDNGIRVYSIPECDPDEDEDYKEQFRQLNAAMPFAVSASLESHDVRGKQVLGRAYPWGVIETENLDHSDFVRLRSLLVTHMQDLREVTHDVHYENYRSRRLADTSGQVPFAVPSADSTLIDEDFEASRRLKEKEAQLKLMEMKLLQMQEELKAKQEVHNENGQNGSSGH